MHAFARFYTIIFSANSSKHIQFSNFYVISTELTKKKKNGNQTRVFQFLLLMLLKDISVCGWMLDKWIMQGAKIMGDKIKNKRNNNNKKTNRSIYIMLIEDHDAGDS